MNAHIYTYKQITFILIGKKLFLQEVDMQRKVRPNKLFVSISVIVGKFYLSFDPPVVAKLHRNITISKFVPKFKVRMLLNNYHST